MLRSNRSAGGCVAPTEGKRRSGHGRLTTSSSVAGAAMRPKCTASPSLQSPSSVASRSEEHTSELQSLAYLVCRLLLDCSGGLLDLHSFPTRRSSDLRP